MKAVITLIFALAAGYFVITAFHAITFLFWDSHVDSTLEAIETGLIRFLVCLGFGVFLMLVIRVEGDDD